MSNSAFQGPSATSVSNADGTITSSPTTGAIVVSRPAITGDVTIAGGSNTSVLATVNGNTGTILFPKITVNGKGLITAVSSLIVTKDLVTQSAAVASVATTITPNDGTTHTYDVGGYLTVTAISINTITLQVAWTDENAASQTASFFAEGTTTAAVGATGSFPFPSMVIHCNPNTSITIKTTVVGVGSETYDVGGYILQLS